MPPKETHEIKMMYAVYEDGTKKPIIIDEIKDLTLEEAEPILEEHNFVKVVKCKDCVYYKGILGDCCHVMTVNNCPMDFVPEDDDYCSWGVPWTEDLYGRWKDKNNHTQYCSECGFEETIWRTSEYNFCPKCGTKMKGENK